MQKPRFSINMRLLDMEVIIKIENMLKIGIYANKYNRHNCSMVYNIRIRKKMVYTGEGAL